MFNIKCYIVSKDLKTGDCEDSLAVNLKCGRFAVADGVTNSRQPEIVSKLMCDYFVRGGMSIINWPLEFGKSVLPAISKEWVVKEEKIFSQLTEWHQEVAQVNRDSYGPGASTFAGIEIDKVNNKVHYLILGDCTLFFIKEDGSYFAINSGQESHEKGKLLKFNNTPNCIVVEGLGRPQRINGKWETGSFDIENGYVILMTDGCAEWFQSAYAKKPDTLENLWNLPNNEAFAKLADTERTKNGKMDDDLAAIMLRIDDDAQMENTTSVLPPSTLVVKTDDLVTDSGNDSDDDAENQHEEEDNRKKEKESDVEVIEEDLKEEEDKSKDANSPTNPPDDVVTNNPTAAVEENNADATTNVQEPSIAEEVEVNTTQNGLNNAAEQMKVEEVDDGDFKLEYFPSDQPQVVFIDRTGNVIAGITENLGQDDENKTKEDNNTNVEKETIEEDETATGKGKDDKDELAGNTTVSREPEKDQPKTDSPQTGMESTGASFRGKYCPNCGYHTSRHSVFCPICGYRMIIQTQEHTGNTIVSREPEKDQPKTDSPQTGMESTGASSHGKYCPKCGYHTSQKSLFCPFCGHRMNIQTPQITTPTLAENQELVLPTVHCKVCGTLFDSIACPNCGHPHPNGTQKKQSKINPLGSVSGLTGTKPGKQTTDISHPQDVHTEQVDDVHMATTNSPIINNLIANMVEVEGGTFNMGGNSEQENNSYDDEKPSHEVTISSFSIGRYQVTQEEWETVMGKSSSFFDGARLPKEYISWDDCQEFIQKLNAMTGMSFRLPTEAEWEFAARGGNMSKGFKYSGSDDLGEVAWYFENSGLKTHQVGTKTPNELGLYDMSGNVMEWCSDWYGKCYPSSQTDPKGAASGYLRVVRGGSWDCIARNCRVFDRLFYAPDRKNYNIGFRLALSIPTTNSQIISNLINNMVHVEGGTFYMGANSEQEDNYYDDEKPSHEVTLSSFSIGRYEVTQEEWEAVMGTNPSIFKGVKRPVENIAWGDCQEFISKLNAMTGMNFRLPTEAEWEFAARGGNNSRGFKYSGSDNLDEVVWYRENSYDKDVSKPHNGTHPVGQKSPNELGLYDMSGNLWEWCGDWYGEYSFDPQINPRSLSSGTCRVCRGGCWISIANYCRVSNRNCYVPNKFNSYIGFRLAL